MERHRLIDTCINNGLRHFLDDLQEPHPSGICGTLGEEEQYFPSKLCRDSPDLPYKLYQLHKFHPIFWFGWGGCLLHRVCLPQPCLEVIFLQVRVAPYHVHPYMADFRLHFRLFRESVFNLEWGNVGGDWSPQRVQVLPMIQCSVFPGDLFRIRL